MSTSNALAQHHVPGGGPVGSPGNPGTYHPPMGNPGNPSGGGYHPPVGNPYPGNNGGYGGHHGGDGDGDGDDHGHGGYGGNHYPSYPNTYPSNYPSYPGNYPNYPSYPNTYPNQYPNSYPMGPCVINSQYNGSSQYYTVFDGRGNYITSAYDYSQALQTAESYDRMGYCRGVRDNTGVNPNPYPNPNPQQTYCTVMPGADAYGRQFYRVLDGAGRIISTTSDYAQATQVSRTDARCFQLN